MKYLNQYEYRHIPYITHTKAAEEPNRVKNVASSGCGPCSVCMCIDLLTDKELPIEECIKLSEGCGANHSAGTDMSILGPVVAEKFDLAYSKTSDLDEAIRHLQCGGAIVAHVSVHEGQEQGLFTKRGHYIALISTDGEEFCILDPSYTPEKFETPDRVGKVNTKNAPYLYCDVQTVHAEAHEEKPKYHLFSGKKAQ
jgi:hypothetical protein